MVSKRTSETMNRILAACLCLTAFLIVITPVWSAEAPRRPRTAEQKIIQLPEPNKSGPVSIETAINIRRNPHQFASSSKSPLNLAQVGQLAWAAQGITDKQSGLRAAPSISGMNPLELYFVMPDGVYAYDPEGNSLKQISTLDQRKQLSAAALGLGAVEDAPCDIIIAGSTRKVAAKYGNKAQNLISLEAGYAAENIQLQAVSMGLGAIPVGDFEPRNVARICGLTPEIDPLIIVSVGYPLVQPASEEASETSAKLVKKALIVIPPTQFADNEFFEIQKILTNAGITCTVASSKVGMIQGAVSGLVASEIALDALKIQNYDAVIFIDGPGIADYYNSPLVLGIVREASARNKVIAGIGAAPMILANSGILRGMKATGQLQLREQIKKAGAQFTGLAVERDGFIITANDPAVTAQFARAIVTVLKGNMPAKTRTR